VLVNLIKFYFNYHCYISIIWIYIWRFICFYFSNWEVKWSYWRL